MYLDYTHSSRTSFRYEYTGEELLLFAWRKLEEFCQKERFCREQVIILTKDPTINPNDRRVEDMKKEIVRVATLVEELTVHVHQFTRERDRKFSLSLGDVVFFGLVNKDITSFVEQRITPQ